MKPDNDRFVTYYNEVKDKLFTYLMVRLQFDRKTAEDLMMDVVVKAYEHFSKFDETRASFKTWIFTMAHNHLVNFWRDQKKSVSLEGLEEEGIYPATTESGHEAGRQSDRRNITHILSMMKESEREIISMRYFQELDYAEIASITGRNEGAIRTSLSRALDRFSDLYKKFYS
jgi:RNA polymerase sigma-70 factor (ECF subfamily)